MPPDASGIPPQPDLMNFKFQITYLTARRYKNFLIKKNALAIVYLKNYYYLCQKLINNGYHERKNFKGNIKNDSAKSYT